MLIKQEILHKKKITRFLEPNLIFKINQPFMINDAMDGIQYNRPYDYNDNTRQFDRIYIILIAPDDRKIEKKALRLLEFLEEGVGNYYRGFSKFFSLEEVEYPKSQEEIIHYEKNSEDDIGYVLMENYPLKEKSSKTIYFVVAVGNDYKALKDTTNYYGLKKVCLRLGYPVQYVSDYESSENITYSGFLQKLDNKRELAYALWNFCVAIYAKAGGIPWLLKNPNTVDVSIGIRFARRKNGGFTTGFISIFDKYGMYKGFYSEKFDDKRYNFQESDFKNYSSGLTVPSYLIQKILHNSKIKFKDIMGHAVQKIAVQKLGRFGREETDGIKQAFVDLDINNFALVEIFNDTNLRFFTDNNRSLNIDRGICFPMADDWGFLCTTGDYEYTRLHKNHPHYHQLGTPRPLLVTIKTNKDCYESYESACQDIFTLTALHYQTVTHNEIRLPCPLLFSHQIAKFNAYDINPHDRLKNTPWFL